MFLSPQGDPLRSDPQGIPGGWELGAWIHMSDFILNMVEPKFHGIVLHKKANPDSRIIAIRGTEHAIEWFDHAFGIPVPFRQVPRAGPRPWFRQDLQHAESDQTALAQRTCALGPGSGSRDLSRLVCRAAGTTRHRA
jgi:hypothetical protein